MSNEAKGKRGGDSLFQEIIRPTLVLILVSVVVGALLAVTYNVAGIADLASAGLKQEVLDEAMPDVLPAGTSLKSMKTGIDDANILGVYKDEGGAGIAVHVSVKGYSDGLQLLIGLDSGGVITGIKALENQETNGIGSKALTPEYFQSFVGKSAGVTVGKGGDVDAFAGATYTSKGIGDGVNKAFEAYEAVKGDLS